MSAEKSLRIAIVGAGITGLTTAIALRKLPNVDVHIYERATELRELGQALAMGPNGLRTLEKLGVHQVLDDDIGFKCPSSFRPHLQETLLDHIPREIIHLDKRVIDVQADVDQGVNVSFTDGTKIHADLLVGADGIRSSVRNFFAPDFELKWSGLIAYRSAFDMKLLEGIDDLPEDTMQWWSPKDGILTTRMGKGKYGIVAFHSVNPSTDAHLLERAHWDETSDVELLRDLYKDFHPVVHSIVAAAPQVRTYPNFYGGFLDTYEFEGRVVLAGDAAHSHGGALAANSSLGIDDAYCLYLSFLDAVSSDGERRLSPNDLKRALQLYVATRKPHAEKVLKVAHAMYDSTNERLWKSEPETDEQFRERMRNRPDASWVHEYDMAAAFERTKDEMRSTGG